MRFRFGDLTFTVTLLLFSVVFSEMELVAPNGKIVVLKDDYSWEWVSKGESSPKAKEFLVPKSSKNKVNSKKVNCTFHYNDSLWEVKKKILGDKEIEINPKNGQVFGMIISEKEFVPIEALLDVAAKNARSVSTNFVVSDKEERMVNGKKITMMQMNATVEGLDFTYLCYYYSDEKFGSLQYLTYTYKSSLDRYKSQMEDLLNGLVINDGKK